MRKIGQDLIKKGYEKRIFACAKAKTQIDCAVIAQLISAIVFAIWIV